MSSAAGVIGSFINVLSGLKVIIPEIRKEKQAGADSEEVLSNSPLTQNFIFMGNFG